MKLMNFLPALFLITPVGGLTESNFDYLLTNAHVYGESAGTAIGVKGHDLAALGPAPDLQSQCGQGCTTVDLKGAYLFPAFHDAHAHAISGGAGFFRVHVSGSNPRSI